MISYSDAIVSLIPNAQFSIIEDRYETLEWFCDEIIPSEDQIKTEVIRLEEEEVRLEYTKLRAIAYPTIQDQLDMLYWDNVNGTSDWVDSISKVKEMYPKP